MASLGKTQTYLNVTVNLLRIKFKTFIERAPEAHIVGETHYLLHRPVARDEKFTAKLRSV